MKPFIIAFIFLFMTGSLFFCNIRTLTYLTIISIFFPIYIPIMGRDAMTTGTISILFLYLKYLIECFRERRFIKEKYDFWIYLLIMFGAISIISPILTGTLRPYQIGPAVRIYFGFLGAVLFFLVIKNSAEYKDLNNLEYSNNHIQKLLNLFIIFISLHILISVSIKFFPSIESVFKIFYTRDIEVLEMSQGGRMGIERVRSFVMTPEIYGEILATLIPIVIYKIFKFRAWIWFFCLLLYCLGLILAVTRSGILLFLIGVIFSILYFSREKIGKAFALSYILLTLFAILLIFKSDIFGDILLRLQDALETFRSSGNIAKTINRDDVFLPAWNLTISNLNFFGNGTTEFHFHNLFLTTLHQKGIFGAILFFVVLLYPAFRLIKTLNIATSNNKSFIFSCLLSITIFLINETKFEFTRSSSYQQICWGLFATYFLVSRTIASWSIENGPYSK